MLEGVEQTALHGVDGYDLLGYAVKALERLAYGERRGCNDARRAGMHGVVGNCRVVEDERYGPRWCPRSAEVARAAQDELSHAQRGDTSFTRPGGQVDGGNAYDLLVESELGRRSTIDDFEFGEDRANFHGASSSTFAVGYIPLAVC